MATHGKSGAHATRCKVLVVDDHPVVAQGLARLIGQEPDMEACPGADNVADAIRQVKTHGPDVVVIDVSLKGSSGMELIELIKEHDKEIKTLVWSAFDEGVYAERALQAGALGYVNKQESADVLVGAIRHVSHGEVWISPAVTNRILRRVGGGQSLDADPIASLSTREIEVFRLLGQGITTLTIARQLGVSRKTVEAHREKIKVKLNLANAAALNRQAVQWVLENG
jgi:DNA-binding NarL/FixJ family response regulator